MKRMILAPNPGQSVQQVMEKEMQALRQKLEAEGLLAQVALWSIAGKVPCLQETSKEGWISLGKAAGICAQYGLIDEDEGFIGSPLSYFLEAIGDDGMFVGHANYFFTRVGELRRENPEALEALARMSPLTLKDIPLSILKVLERKNLADQGKGLLPKFVWLAQTALKLGNTGVTVINPFPQDTELHSMVEGLL